MCRRAFGGDIFALTSHHITSHHIRSHHFTHLGADSFVFTSLEYCAPCQLVAEFLQWCVDKMHTIMLVRAFTPFTKTLSHT